MQPEQSMANKDCEYYNKSMKPWLQNDGNGNVFNTHNEGKSVNAEIIIGTLKKCIHIKNEYIDKLADIVNIYIS